MSRPTYYCRCGRALFRSASMNKVAFLVHAEDGNGGSQLQKRTDHVGRKPIGLLYEFAEMKATYFGWLKTSMCVRGRDQDD